MALYDHMVVLSREEYRQLQSGKESQAAPSRPEVHGSQVNNIEVTNGGTILIGRKDDITSANEGLDEALTLDSLNRRDGKLSSANLSKKGSKAGRKLAEEWDDFTDNDHTGGTTRGYGTKGSSKNKYVEKELQQRSAETRDQYKKPSMQIIEDQQKRMKNFIADRFARLRGEIPKEPLRYERIQDEEEMSIDSDHNEKSHEDDHEEEHMDVDDAPSFEERNKPTKSMDVSDTKESNIRGRKRNRDENLSKIKKKPRDIAPSHTQKRMGGEQSNNTVGAKTIRTIPPSIAKKRHGNENADDRGKLVRTISPSYAKKRGAANPPTNVRGKQTRFIPPSHAQKRAIDADDINDNGKIVRVNSPERYDSPALEQLPEKSKKKQTIPRSKSQKRKMDDDYGQVKKYINLERGYKRKIDDGLGGVKKYRHLENGYTPKMYTHHVIKGQKRKPEDFIESVSKYRHLENGAHPKVYIHPTIKGEKRPSDTVLGGVKKYQNLEISDAAPSLQELQEIWADEIEQVYE